MKVKAIKKGYYENKVRKVGEIFDYKEKDKNLPSWVTLADGIDTSKVHKQTKKEEKPQEQETVLSDVQKQQKLDLLINEGIEKNIVIEDADKKTIDEQIAELENLLGKE